MNVLITNSQEIQAYIILRSLRPLARRIVITEGGDSVGSTGFRGMAAYSRFVDARYAVPHFAGDWLAGRLGADNTPAEETYIRRIEEICALEQIDVIYPSLDPEVYLFAKNKQRLASRGVLAVVPDPEVIRVPMDKAQTIRAAQRVGFPCPKTWFPETAADMARIAAESAPPWIVKPRFTAHGAHMAYAENAEGLSTAYAQVSEFQPLPIVQEFLRGGSRRNYYVTVGRDGQVVSLLTPEVTRTFSSGYRVACKTAVSASTGPYLEELRALVRELGLWGSYTIQTKVDPRDGVPRLLEINPRMGQHLWWRTGLGVNEPLICLQIARGETPTGNCRFPDGVLLLDPFHDLFFLYSQLVQSMFRIGARLLRRDNAGPQSELEPDPPGVLATLCWYRKDYMNRRRKVISPEIRNLLQDPYPCLQALWFKFRSMTGTYLQRFARALPHRGKVEVTS